jgi:hypothetical protein
MPTSTTMQPYSIPNTRCVKVHCFIVGNMYELLINVPLFGNKTYFFSKYGKGPSVEKGILVLCPANYNSSSAFYLSVLYYITEKHLNTNIGLRVKYKLEYWSQLVLFRSPASPYFSQPKFIKASIDGRTWLGLFWRFRKELDWSRKTKKIWFLFMLVKM